MGSGGSKIVYPNGTIVQADSLRVQQYNRIFYYWLFLTIAVVAVAGNLLAIGSIIVRKAKRIQKTCIVSLAISDTITVVFFGLNYVDSLSRPIMTWELGEVLCFLIPIGQLLGTMASSVALLIIALDRYHNVFYALSNKWDPKWWICVGGAVILWTICIGISYPMMTFYFYVEITVQDRDELRKAFLCVVGEGTSLELTVYYIVTMAVFFSPILLMFFWLYYKIAFLIWHHRKPVGSKNYQNSSEQEDTGSSNKTTSDTGNKNFNTIIKTKKNLRYERKIRTFKIVVLLMTSFLGCRLPFTIYNVYVWLKELTGRYGWTLNNCFVALNMFNAVLNPFLYTFLNQTISALKKLNDFMCRVFFCCFSNSEFEDFEKEDFPKLENSEIQKKDFTRFVDNVCHKKDIILSSRVKFGCVTKHDEIICTEKECTRF